ncbi:MAG: lamin tail domain-containing protein [Roseibacillus sp.]
MSIFDFRDRPAAAAVAFATTLFAVLAVSDPVQGAGPVITEFMADNNNTLSGAGGTTPDWIEIYNPESTEIDLAGWHLTDNDQDPDQWTFPEGATITSGGYLLVYASGEGANGPEGEYHTNFKLLDQGEYLALVQPDGTVQQEFAPVYPRQDSDVSYGLPPGQETYGYFTTPTPGAPNNSSLQGFVKDTTFSHKRGFYDDAFQLEVTTATPGASIYYTTNGVTPGPASPRVVAPDPESPPVLSLTISATTIVRTYAEKPGYQSTNTDTQTYIFIAQASRQRMSRSITGDPVWGPQMRDALLEIPSISLVVREEIPTEPIMSPPEIPVSIEMIFPDGRDGFQADAGIERFGGQYTLYPKHALRVSFKESYGPKRLKFDLFSDTPYGGDTAVKSFDQILLRNGSHDSLFSPHYPHSRGTYIRSRYFFDRQLEMGHLSMRGKFVHVYLNGFYFGHYHLMERPNADFMATHLGGEEEDYDIMKGRSGIFVSQGTRTAWDYLVANTNNYGLVQRYMDVDSYIDYMLLNFYGGNDHDWYPSHNWIAGRKRERGKFKFFMWDNDFLNRRGGNAGTGSSANTIDNGGPGNMLPALRQHEEFRIRFADRVQKHFFNGGVLTKERVKADFTELAQRISRTIIPETARWLSSAPQPYTPDDFQTYVDWIVDVNAESRSDIVIAQMRSAGLFPGLAAPGITPFGGNIVTGETVSVTNPRAGVLYYTLDGTDPRLRGGGISSTASTENPRTITLPDGPGMINARILSQGNWSPLVEAEFIVGKLAAPGDIVITELNYRPALPTTEEAAAGFDSRTHFEFLEIMNVSAETIQLANLSLVEGVDFQFASSTKTSLAPGERALLVFNRAAFLFRYPDVPPGTIIGEYAPDKLNNDGEEIVLTTSAGTVICQFTYNDVPPWPIAADGDGYTLVLRDPADNPDPVEPLNWQSSVNIGGTPGTDELTTPFAEWMADHNATDPDAPFGTSSLSNLLAYAVGADLALSPEAALPAPSIVDDGGIDYPALRFRVRQDAGEVTYLVEISENLVLWQSGGAFTTHVDSPQDNGDGTVTLTVRSLQSFAAKPNQFLRLRVSLAP